MYTQPQRLGRKKKEISLDFEAIIVTYYFIQVYIMNQNLQTELTALGAWPILFSFVLRPSEHGQILQFEVS